MTRYMCTETGFLYHLYSFGYLFLRLQVLTSQDRNKNEYVTLACGCSYTIFISDNVTSEFDLMMGTVELIVLKGKIVCLPLDLL